MKKLVPSIMVFVVVIGLILTGFESQAAEIDTTKAAAFYKGKTLSFYIPSRAGGGHDMTARIWGEAVAKILGAKLEPLNKAGGDLLLAPVYVASIPHPNGLQICEASTLTTMLAQVMGVGGFARMDISKWNWLASMRGSTNVLFVPAESKIMTFSDLIKTKGLKMDVAGATSPSALNATMILQKICGMEVEVISAITGVNAKIAAVLRGEFDFADVPARNVLQFKDKLRPLATEGAKRDPLMPDVPTLEEAMKTAGIDTDDPENKFWIRIVNNGNDSLGSAFAPEGVPADRVELLRQAFEKASRDPDLIAKGKKANLNFAYIPGRELAESITEFVKMDPAKVEDMKKWTATIK